jgi:hypothetical protein
VTPAPSASVPAPLAPTARGWTVEALLAPGTRWLALAALAVSFVFPVKGLGVDLCFFHASTGLPCPGCGLTRGLSALSQGDFSTALAMHPFVFALWPTFLLLAALAVLPRRWREPVELRLRESRLAAKVYELVFWAFLGFGLLRLAAFALTQQRFP